MPLANEAATQSIATPSISQKKVLFLANEQIGGVMKQTIYTSNNGGPSIPVISTGDQLEGRSITSLRLSDNGRAISDNSAVFVATFDNFQEALFRVDL